MTAQRVSLSNYFTDITYPQFVDYITKAVTLLQEAHQTPCHLSISGLRVPKACVEAMGDDPAAEEKLRYRLSHKLNAGAIGKAAWDAADHVEVFIMSHEERKPLACVEFKGCLPKTATFCFQEGDEKVREKMERSYPHTIKGHGYTSHHDKTQWSLCR